MFPHEDKKKTQQRRREGIEDEREKGREKKIFRNKKTTEGKKPFRGGGGGKLKMDCTNSMHMNKGEYLHGGVLEKKGTKRKTRVRDCLPGEKKTKKSYQRAGGKRVGTIRGATEGGGTTARVDKKMHKPKTVQKKNRTRKMPGKVLTTHAAINPQGRDEKLLGGSGS